MSFKATITKAITFGGFLSDITGGQQGVLESFLGHCVAGGIFCMFGGQPLTVLGCTGPVLVFEKILVDFCKDYDVSSRHHFKSGVDRRFMQCSFLSILIGGSKEFPHP